MNNPIKELRIAVEDGSIDRVTQLLDQGVSMIMGHFVIATRLKHYGILETFISRGWDINTDVSGSIPSVLFYAFEDMKLLKWLLDHGADPNKRCRQRDCTSLSLAVREGPLDAIRLLLQNGGSVQHGQLLHYASIRDKADNLQVLEFIYGSDPELSDSRINKLLDEDYPEFAMNERAGLGTPLHFAALSGSLGMVRFLKGKGADSSIRDPYGRTPISYAVYKGYEEVVQFLREGNMARIQDPMAAPGEVLVDVDFTDTNFAALSSENMYYQIKPPSARYSMDACNPEGGIPLHYHKFPGLTCQMKEKWNSTTNIEATKTETGPLESSHRKRHNDSSFIQVDEELDKL
ncbi:hypothetical protein FQN54_000107 [Arachnomyces sp. PD_36]|nr:hypothetical protein FQN54_000107 [Arachnomyces sp. PD_36]